MIGASNSHIKDWLSVPNNYITALFLPHCGLWSDLALRFHDRFAPDFSSADPRLAYVDSRRRRFLRKLTALTFLVLAAFHGLAFALAPCLSLISLTTTRRHLVLDACMIAFVTLFMRVRGIGPGTLVATHSSILNVAGILVLGCLYREGAAGVAFAAGVTLGSCSLTQLLLTPSGRRLSNDRFRAATSGAATLAAIVLALAAGGTLLLALSPLTHQPHWVRLLAGTAFGIIGGAVVGGALAWYRSHLHRLRERVLTRQIVARWMALCAPVAALATAVDPEDPDLLTNGPTIGLLCGAMIVALSLGPIAAARSHVSERRVPIVTMFAAIALVALLLPFFPHVGLRWLVVPMLLGGVLVEALTVGLLLLLPLPRARAPRQAQETKSVFMKV